MWSSLEKQNCSFVERQVYIQGQLFVARSWRVWGFWVRLDKEESVKFLMRTKCSCWQTHRSFSLVENMTVYIVNSMNPVSAAAIIGTFLSLARSYVWNIYIYIYWVWIKWIKHPRTLVSQYKIEMYYTWILRLVDTSTSL